MSSPILASSPTINVVASSPGVSSEPSPVVRPLSVAVRVRRRAKTSFPDQEGEASHTTMHLSSLPRLSTAHGGIVQQRTHPEPERATEGGRRCP